MDKLPHRPDDRQRRDLRRTSSPDAPDPTRSGSSTLTGQASNVVTVQISYRPRRARPTTCAVGGRASHQAPPSPRPTEVCPGSSPSAAPACGGCCGEDRCRWSVGVVLDLLAQGHRGRRVESLSIVCITALVVCIDPTTVYLDRDERYDRVCMTDEDRHPDGPSTIGRELARRSAPATNPCSGRQRQRRPKVSR